MALTRMNKVFHQPRFTIGYLCGPSLASPVEKPVLISYHGIANRIIGRLRTVNVVGHQLMSPRYLSSSALSGRICWEVSTQDVLLRKLETNLEHHQVDEAWLTFNDFKSLYGFPLDSLVSRLINELTYSSEPRWLSKACDLVISISKEKPSLLQREISAKLSLSLARAHMPIPASTILRIMLERNIVPPIDVLSLIVSHLVKTEIGACLASNILFQICDCFTYLGADKNHLAKAMKPDTMVFNLVLDACLRFKSYLKGQLIVELMAQIGVVADAHSIIMVAQIYEMNGQRNEIKKFKNYIDRMCTPFVCNYRQFYDSLLRTHFKFDDIDAVAEVLLNINGIKGSITASHKIGNEAQRPFQIPIGSPNLRASLKLQIAPEHLQKESTLCVDQKEDLISSRHGKLFASNRLLAKLIIGYKRQERVSEFSKLIICLQKVDSSCEENLVSDLISACMHFGWLETAHDILDDMEIAGVHICSATYMALLRSYHSKQMFKEAKALSRQMVKVGLLKDFTDEMNPSVYLPEVVDNASSSIGYSDLTDILVQEIREESSIPSMIYEINSSIYYFCKAKMMQDAVETYRKMKKMKIQMTEQTFAYLLLGFSSLHMYRDITHLWGDMKSYMMSRNLFVSRDLYELLLLNFIRGGYFERVLEVIGHMKQRNMYVDKAMYKNEYLKLHKNLYRRLKASDANNDAQRNRIQYVRTFRRWVGIDEK